MGATLTTEKIANAVGEDVSFYSTFGWHPRSVAVALANLRYWKRHGRALLKNVEARSADFATRLAEMSFASKPTVRIKGLAVGVEFEDEGYGEELAETCREEGLLLSGGEDYITMFPPLTIDQTEVMNGLDILEGCL
jgi:acetylornithine/succinyldiaminopimelate/putrescine aminotransferase